MVPTFAVHAVRDIGAEFLKKDVEYVGKRRYLLAYQKPIRHLTTYPFPNKFCATYEL